MKQMAISYLAGLRAWRGHLAALGDIDDHWCKVLACDRLCFCG